MILEKFISALGRRKTASARVRISKGSGKITVNGRDYTEYFPIVFWQQKVVSPLEVVGMAKDFDVSVKVVGSGVNGQAEAVRHGIARALLAFDEKLKPLLKAQGLLTRDARAKERKKPGLHGARRGHQWRKR